MSSTEENPVPIVGYADRLSVQPGEAIRFMISCDFASYKAEIVRLRSAECRPKGPARQEEAVQTQVSGEYRGRKQTYPHGSYGIIATDSRLPSLGSFSIQCWIFPTTPQGGVQGIVTSANESKGPGLGLYIDGKGAVALVVKDSTGRVEWISTEKPLRSHTWYFVAATYDGDTGGATVYQVPQRLFPGDQSAAQVQRRVVPLSGAGLSHSPILIGASWGNEEVEPFPIKLFNGKIENPRIFSRALGAADIDAIRGGATLNAFGLDLVADWDFSQGIPTDVIVDRSGYALHGKVVNYPKRAVTSHSWNGDEFDFKHAPEQYAAIHFHDDDLDDCRWDVDFTFDVPTGFKSGVYAARLESNGHTQYVPFFVRPRRGESSAKIAFLVPTLSYLAYADEHIQSDPEQRATIDFPGFEYPTRPMDKYLIKNRLHSLYDRHSDGSGVCYSSRMRPVLTIGPEYRLAILGSGRGSPHQFSADLLIIDWLEAKGFEYDVITDEDLQRDGASLLRPYKAVVSGSHHEYWSGHMLDSLEQYLNAGGRFMYMGGNGFYWVTAVDPRKPHVVEVRRWGGTQSWRSDPGEFYLSSTGEMGGLWVNRGRAPQRYVGIGFDSQGFDLNSPYKRMPDSFDLRAAFVFEGVGKDEVIGDFDSAIQEHGAAGYEIDRLDFRLGSPSSTLLLATATGFSDNYQHVIEETDTTLPGQGGSVNPFVRADMVYCRYPNEGAVFSTGSISWSGCLYYHGYDNNVSRITENVLRAFSTLEELP